MANAKDLTGPPHRNILIVGDTGAGKTTQILSLPGKKFVYAFDPNCLASLAGYDLEYEEFLPDEMEIDATIKGFNKGSRPDDRPASKIEPTLYTRWVDDITEKNATGFFDPFDWIVFDSLTFLQKGAMDRCLWINNRYGKTEELGDYRIVGSKLANVFRPIFASKKSILCTGHLTSFQDDKTKKITTQLNLMGQARAMLPLGCTDIMECFRGDTDKGGRYLMRTRPDPRGLKCIRSTIRGLEEVEDITIDDLDKPQEYGIGKLLLTKGIKYAPI